MLRILDVWFAPDRRQKPSTHKFLAFASAKVVPAWHKLGQPPWHWQKPKTCAAREDEAVFRQRIIYFIGLRPLSLLTCHHRANRKCEWFAAIEWPLARFYKGTECSTKASFFCPCRTMSACESTRRTLAIDFCTCGTKILLEWELDPFSCNDSVNCCSLSGAPSCTTRKLAGMKWVNCQGRTCGHAEASSACQ